MTKTGLALLSRLCSTRLTQQIWLLHMLHFCWVITFLKKIQDPFYDPFLCLSLIEAEKTQLCICCCKWHCSSDADGGTYTFVFVTMANVILEKSLTVERKWKSLNMTTTLTCIGEGRRAGCMCNRKGWGDFDNFWKEHNPPPTCSLSPCHPHLSLSLSPSPCALSLSLLPSLTHSLSPPFRSLKAGALLCLCRSPFVSSGTAGDSTGKAPRNATV